jgi:hypothetical protein
MKAIFDADFVIFAKNSFNVRPRDLTVRGTTKED